MNETSVNVRSLKIEHLPNIIADLRLQKEDLKSQLNDLIKVRSNLDEKADSVVSSYYQMSDVTARLNERLAITKKKLDDAVAKGAELQSGNAAFSDKDKMFRSKCEEEKKMNLVKIVSDWGKMVSELSEQFLSNTTIYNTENLHEVLQKRSREAEELQQKVNTIKMKLTKQEELKCLLEQELTDENTCRNFLSGNEANQVLSILDSAIKRGKQKKSLLAEKLELEKFISENEESIF